MVSLAASNLSGQILLVSQSGGEFSPECSDLVVLVSERRLERDDLDRRLFAYCRCASSSRVERTSTRRPRCRVYRRVAAARDAEHLAHGCCFSLGRIRPVARVPARCLREGRTRSSESVRRGRRRERRAGRPVRSLAVLGERVRQRDRLVQRSVGRIHRVVKVDNRRISLLSAGMKSAWITLGHN